MRKFMILGVIGILITATAAIEYYPDQYPEGYTYATTEENPQLPVQPVVATAAAIPETEYYTFSAPEDFNDSKDVQRLSSIVRPQRVVFIRTPEKNIFSITAEQLAKKDSLNIFVLRRQTNSDGLLSQLEEIRERAGQKPNVQFVKYRTPEDIERAKQAIYNDFESLPGPSQYHEDTKIPVHEFNPNSQNANEDVPVEKPENPIIFRIIRHSPATDADIQTMLNDDANDEPQYLPTRTSLQ